MPDWKNGEGYGLYAVVGLDRELHSTGKHIRMSKNYTFRISCRARSVNDCK